MGQLTNVCLRCCAEKEGEIPVMSRSRLSCAEYSEDVQVPRCFQGPKEKKSKRM